MLGSTTFWAGVVGLILAGMALVHGWRRAKQRLTQYRRSLSWEGSTPQERAESCVRVQTVLREVVSKQGTALNRYVRFVDKVRRLWVVQTPWELYLRPVGFGGGDGWDKAHVVFGDGRGHEVSVPLWEAWTEGVWVQQITRLVRPRDLDSITPSRVLMGFVNRREGARAAMYAQDHEAVLRPD